MKDGLTTHVVLAAGPNLLGTFLKHYLTPGKNREDAKGVNTAREQLMYDEVFELVQHVLNISTLHTADALQKLCQQRTPVPPWVAMHRIRIPQATSGRAAEVLIDALGGEEMAFKVAGGTKWWQVRAGDGVECEWITMKKDYREKKDRSASPMTQCRSQKKKDTSATHMAPSSSQEESGEANPDDDDCGFVPEMDRLRCMLFVHGGGYYCGSINTHHYFIWRLAKKIRGRVFAVNYRMAPQYPFPCAIQDVLASYFYLIDPPPGAAHRPVDPKNIIVAGDSAGGGLSLVLLQILRDLGLPLPGGSILMSPWCDLTHSFPSVLQNTKTPSSLWPPPSVEMTHSMHSRIVHKVHHAVGKPHEKRHPNHVSSDDDAIRTSNTRDLAMLRPFLQEQAQKRGEALMINPADKFRELAPRGEKGATTLASGDNALRTRLGDKEIMVDTQIQLYATNAQLCHPYVSPVLGNYGGLPPMLVIAGNSEVLRDEVIYLAHKAANPSAFPVREDVKAMMPHWADIDGKHPPTDVHLQVYDGVGHDIPLFCMTKPGHSAVRAIGSFARWVTPSAQGSHATPATTTGIETTGVSSGEASPVLEQLLVDTPGRASPAPSSDGQTSLGTMNGATASLGYVDARLRQLTVDEPTSSRSGSQGTPSRPNPDKLRGSSWGGLPKVAPGRAGWPGIYAGPNPFTNHMIRERVSFVGLCRPLEPESELSAMTMPTSEIGIIKTAATMRYLEGQAKWDHRFRRTFKKVARHREKNLKRADKDGPKIVERWRRAQERQNPGSASASASATPKPTQKATPTISRKETPVQSALHTPRDSPRPSIDSVRSSGSVSSRSTCYVEDVADVADVPTDETWAWQWALHDEQPPPSAIVSRRDLPEGRALALQADRIDAAGDSELNALSVWVILAQLFSGDQKDAVQDAKVMRDEAREKKKKKGSKWTGLFGKRKEAKVKPAQA